MQNSSYNIYNASAGSGKTYTLSKAYLKIILSDNATSNYSEILAMTFTNKAVNEMKERILSSLYEFGNVSSIEKAPQMFIDLLEELNTDIVSLQKKAKRTLKEILHNYAFFDVSTIDKFTHRLIRTFAKDLKLPQNFEVVLDTNLLLSEAVDRLVNKAGSNQDLTKILIAFALEKADDDKSWDVSMDIFDMGRELLFKEKHEQILETLALKNLTDFDELKQSLRKKIKIAEELIKDTSKEILSLFEKNGLEFNDFRSSWFPKFIKETSILSNKVNFDAGWKQDFENATLYTKTLSEDKKATIDQLHPTFNSLFQEIKNTFFFLSFLKNAYKNILPLTVLNALQKEIKNIELERDEIPLATFNAIISKEIKDQPVPFIYERLGEKYRHYFIDEFQDTSELQWTNLIPLIGNALESEDEKGNLGSLLLVGDTKQAIYRWRGGKAEQFLDLINEKNNPFVLKPKIENLPTNFRSYDEVIKFNNSFFTSISSNLNNEVYKTLFKEGNQQNYNSKQGGYVQLTFIEEEEKNQDELYCDEVLNTIQLVLEKKHTLKDICILVRDKKNGITIANFLSLNRIPIISSETLLLNNNPKVKFLINLLRYSLNTEDEEAAYQILYFLSEKTETLHTYIYSNIKNLSIHLINNYKFDLEKLRQSSVYDGFEQAIKLFKLTEDSDAYLTYLLDEVLDLEYKQGSSAKVFIDYWEKKKENISISTPIGMNAVQIMTIHKSKGLEFPIVIYPYANSDIYKEIKPKMWLAVNEKEFNGFENVLINKNQKIVNYNPHVEALYEDEQQKLELDAFNVLYVALTRAEKNLFIISKKELDSKTKKPKDKYYSGLFINYLVESGMWSDQQNEYSFGILNNNNLFNSEATIQEEIRHQLSYKERSSFNIVAKSGMLWDTTIEAALNKGNTIHYILSLIETEADIEDCFKTIKEKGELNDNEIESIKNKIISIINHPKLKPYYSINSLIKNETDIITKNGTVLRPDRLVIKNNEVTIIDYKTGKRNISYKDQVELYALALEDMGYKITEKVIVYINETVNPEFV